VDVEALTPTERRVAEMAAQGLKNKEIAQALFVSRKTVEMHLSRSQHHLQASVCQDSVLNLFHGSECFGEFLSRVDVELAVDVAEVHFDGLAAYEQRLGDLLVGEP
jgi:DNA-binding NarL/FixJ family response regulator